MYAGDAVLTLRLDAEHWRIQVQTVNYEEYPQSSQWMLDLVRVNMEKVLKAFNKRVPYNVLLSADGDQFVSLLELEKGGAMVSVVPAGARVNARALRSMWLSDSTQSAPVVCRHVWLEFEADRPHTQCRYTAHFLADRTTNRIVHT